MGENDTTGGSDESGEASFRILRRALQLIEQPGTWTKRAFARDRQSRPVSPTSDRAVRFCASGALLRAAAEEFKFVVQVGGDAEASPRTFPKGLAQAYRVLGELLSAVVLPSLEAGGEDELEVAYPMRVAEALAGGELTVEDVSWPLLVQTFNDLHAMGQPAMVMCLQAASGVVCVTGGEAQ